MECNDTSVEDMPNRDGAERIQQKVLKMYIRDSDISTCEGLYRPAGSILLVANVSLDLEQKM